MYASIQACIHHPSIHPSIHPSHPCVCACRQAGRQTERRKGRKTERQTERQTDETTLTCIHMHTRADACTCVHPAYICVCVHAHLYVRTSFSCMRSLHISETHRLRILLLSSEKCTSEAKMQGWSLQRRYEKHLRLTTSQSFMSVCKRANHCIQTA